MTNIELMAELCKSAKPEVLTVVILTLFEALSLSLNESETQELEQLINKLLIDFKEGN